jgi:hypothetical protein
MDNNYWSRLTLNGTFIFENNFQSRHVKKPQWSLFYILLFSVYYIKQILKSTRLELTYGRMILVVN